ncbi:MAG: plasmid mobilization protein [Candidatus Freyarchaeota archaeon]
MPVKREKSGHKTELLSVRVTPRIKEIVAQVARSEGLDVSEWLRNLIVVELKRRGSLPVVLMPPELAAGSEVE